MVLALVAPRLYAQVRLAVVDMQRALLETNEGRRAKAQLKRLFESHQETLNSRQEALKRLKSEIQKQASVLSQAALLKRQEEYNKRLVDLQQDFQTYQQELATKEAELTKQILVNLQGVVRQIGQTDGFTGILDQSSVIWSPTHMDLTDRVITEYNRAHPANADAPAAAAPAASEGDAPAARPAAGGAARPAATATPRAGANPHPRGEQ